MSPIFIRILGPDLLNAAFGLLTAIRGVASLIGPPMAGFAVDYFALGVIGYEFMLGRRPYVGRSRKEIRDMIFAK